MRDWTKKYMKSKLFYKTESQLATIRKEAKKELMKSKLAKLKKRMKSRRKRKKYYKNLKR